MIPITPPFSGSGSNWRQKCLTVEESVYAESHISHLYSVKVSLGWSWRHSKLSLHFIWNGKKKNPERKNRKQNQRGTVRAKFWHMYIASLQFYKQMYNNYIINKLLIWDGEEPALHGGRGGSGFFFHLFLLSFVTVWRSCQRRWRRRRRRRRRRDNSSLRGVLVLLCAAAPEIHPTQVVPVRYPVVGAASAVRRRVPAHGAFVEERQGRRRRKEWVAVVGEDEEGKEEEESRRIVD